MRVDYSDTEMAEKGRNGDKYVAHVAEGEMIVPPTLPPEIIAQIRAAMEAQGMNPDEFTVGDVDAKINPETGEQEFFFKKLRKIFSVAAPVAAALIPGIGPVAAAGLGAAGGLAGGGGLKSALLGGLSSGIGSALSTGALANTALGRGLSSIKSGISGALGDFGNLTGLSDVFTSASGALDSLSSGLNNAYEGSTVQDVFRSGGDALKSSGINLGGDTTALSASPAGGGSSSYAGGETLPWLTGSNTGENTMNYTPILSALLGGYSNNEAEDVLLKGQRANQALLAPYANGFDFNPGDLTQDPGYQFNLQEGNQALDRAQLARGGFFSGNALKEAQTFGQGLADNTYNTAFKRALQGREAGLTGALAATQPNTDIGNIKANSATNTGNLFSGALASLLGGDSFTNTGALQGGRGNDLLTMLLKQQLGASAYGG